MEPPTSKTRRLAECAASAFGRTVTEVGVPLRSLFWATPDADKPTRRVGGLGWWPMSAANTSGNRPWPQETSRLAIFTNAVWQMSPGERAAFEGILTQVRPSLAIEIGSAEGGCLERIAAHTDEVHSLDLVEPDEAVRSLENVHLHTGDSHDLLPALLAELSRAGRNVDFVHVDGDHSAEGVKRDLDDLLASASVRQTAILIHDTTNEEVRAGVEQVRFGAYPKVAHVDLDFVAGYLCREESLRHELWGGLGLVLVDASRLVYGSEPAQQRDIYGAQRLLAYAKAALLDEELDSVGQAPAARALSRAVSEEVHELEGQLSVVRAQRDAADTAREELRGEYQNVSTWAREIERQSLEMQASRAVRLGRGYLRLKQRLRLARRG